jgi:hypothetical protein
MEKLERFEQGLKHPLFSIVGRRIILLMVLLSSFFYHIDHATAAIMGL